MKETFEMMNQYKKKTRRKNMCRRLEFIKQSGLEYRILNESIGHIRISLETKTLDVWVSSGKYTYIKSNVYKNGWNDILNILNLGREYTEFCKC